MPAAADGAEAAATSTRPPRLRAVTNTRPSISTRRKYASAPVRSITRCATTLTPSTYRSSWRAESSTVASAIGSSTAVASAPASVTRCAGVRALVQPLLQQFRVRAAAHAPGQRLRVPRRRGGERERAGVLVDAEREHGGLERRHRDPALGDDAHEESDQRAVAGADQGVGVEVRRQVARVRVVVEGDDLHPVPAAQVAEVAEAVGVHGVDQDQAADGVPVHIRGVDHGDGVGVQSLELTHVAVDGAAETDLGLGIELVRRDHGGEGVEVGVGVCGDEFGRDACAPVYAGA